MRQVNGLNQLQKRSVLFDSVSTAAATSILAIKPVEDYAQAAAPVAVAANAASVAVTIAGPLLNKATPTFSDAEGRLVNTGSFVTLSTDPDPATGPAFLKSMVAVIDAATQNVITDAASGKEVVGFLIADTVANTQSIKFYLDNKDGTFTAATLPNGVANILYQNLVRFTLADSRPDVGTAKKFFHGVVDLAVMDDLNQLMKDLYGTGLHAGVTPGHFNGNGAGILTKSIADQIYEHVNMAAGAHAAGAISVVPAGNQTHTDVQTALDGLQSKIDTISGGGTGTSLSSLQTEADNIVAAMNLDTTAGATHGQYLAAPYAAANYIAGKTDLKSMLLALDAQTKAIDTAVGLNANGTYAAYAAGQFTSGASTVANALALLDDALKAHEAAAAGAAGAHTAAQIGVTPAGDLASTNVQAALVELQGDIDALTNALASSNTATSNNLQKLVDNSGLSDTTDGVTYATQHYITNLAADLSTGDTLVKAAGKLDAALYALATLVGLPQNEHATIDAVTGTYILANAPHGVAGNPILTINGVVQNNGDDFTIVDDGTGVVRKIQLVAPFTFDPAKDSAMIWYNAKIA